MLAESERRRKAAYLLKELLHDLWPVVDCEDNVLDTSCNQSLDLVNDHGLVTELNEGLGERESLEDRSWSVLLLGTKAQRPSGVGVGAATYKRAQASAEATDKNEACRRKSVSPLKRAA